ncbi:Hypothetical protein PHPALM_20974 [Phytophthora palmivora]|uniref:Uncharacterized protein n=1 Tax=Phytophthora palmivora TaxID=4796 RepID=A0A2P4XDH2_9STRA|nr:Hypothetical protein PHPALM_20974 [Phytophthora palmivora]
MFSFSLPRVNTRCLDPPLPLNYVGKVILNALSTYTNSELQPSEEEDVVSPRILGQLARRVRKSILQRDDTYLRDKAMTDGTASCPDMTATADASDYCSCWKEPLPLAQLGNGNAASGTHRREEIAVASARKQNKLTPHSSPRSASELSDSSFTECLGLMSNMLDGLPDCISAGVLSKKV